VACDAQAQTEPPARTNASAPADCRCNSGYAHRPFTSYGSGGAVPDNACHVCPQGHHNAIIGVDQCTPCAAGYFLPGLAATSVAACSTCGEDTFSAPGAAQCSPCPLHTQAPAVSGMETDCVCNAGYTGVPGGECATCAAGKFKLTEG